MTGLKNRRALEVSCAFLGMIYKGALLNNDFRKFHIRKSKFSLSKFKNFTSEIQKFHFRSSKISLSKFKNFTFEIQNFHFRSSKIKN